MRRPFLGLVLATLFGFSAAGCGSADSTYPVSGRVVFRDGQPVTSGTIEFTPDAPDRPAARGRIEADGTFRLFTGTRPGAVAGPHRVTVVQLVSPEMPAEHLKKHRGTFAHRKFARPETSGLKRDVEPQANEFLFEVDSAP